MDPQRPLRDEWKLLAELSRTGRLAIGGDNELLALHNLAMQGFVIEDEGEWRLTLDGREYFEAAAPPSEDAARANGTRRSA